MNPTKHSTLKRKLIITFFSLLATLALLILLSGHLLRWYIPYHLSNLGVNSQIKAITIDWLEGKFILKEWVTQSTPNKRLSIQTIGLNWSWDGIWSKDINLYDITIQGSRVDITANDNGISQIGPIDYAALVGEKAAKTTENTSHWSISRCWRSRSMSSTRSAVVFCSTSAWGRDRPAPRWSNRMVRYISGSKKRR